MKAFFILFVFLWLTKVCYGQTNCSLYKDKNCHKACLVYLASDNLNQGSAICEHYLDSAISLCPSFAPAWHEKSVPYLKKGDLIKWKVLIDQAVALDPFSYLPIRGWCRFEFFRDYKGALNDLQKYDTLSNYSHNYSLNGAYELHIVMALCEREMGNNPMAFHYFAIGIDSLQAEKKDFDFVGLYDYIYLGVTKMRMHDYKGAMAAFVNQNRKYDKYAETFYYMGMTYLATGNAVLATANLEKAKELISDESGAYHFHDVYCEMHDTIYMLDIINALKKIPKTL